MRAERTDNPDNFLGEFTIADIFRQIFKHEPQLAHSLRLEFVDTQTQSSLQNILGQFLVIGAQSKFNKALHMVTPDEFSILRLYLHSIGYNVENESDPVSKVVTDYHPDGTPFERTIVITNWKYVFSVLPVQTKGSA